MAGKEEEVAGLPERVGQYHTLYPLEEPAADGNDRVSGKRVGASIVEERFSPIASSPPLFTLLKTLPLMLCMVQLSTALGLRTFVFKAINAHDGQAYALRRVCGKQVCVGGGTAQG